MEDGHLLQVLQPSRGLGGPASRGRAKRLVISLAEIDEIGAILLRALDAADPLIRALGARSEKKAWRSGLKTRRRLTFRVWIEKAYLRARIATGTLSRQADPAQGSAYRRRPNRSETCPWQIAGSWSATHDDQVPRLPRRRRV